MRAAALHRSHISKKPGTGMMPADVLWLSAGSFKALTPRQLCGVSINLLNLVY